MTDPKCFFCHTTLGLEEHHVFYGSGLRKLSEKYKMKTHLCHMHHRGNSKGRRGVHFNKELDLCLKRHFQAIFEQTHSREEFIKIFGRNYR